MKILSRNKLYDDYYSIVNKRNILRNRKIVKKILLGKCKKMMIILGPCSIRSFKETKDFFLKVNNIRKKFKDMFFLARIYLEKPRTISGWKGMIYDPLLNESFKINLGIKKSLNILKFLNEIKFPVVTEFLSNIIVEYIKKYITIGTIGARNYESQIHREFCSNLKMPIGIKNGTHGDVMGAINSIISISKKHKYIRNNFKNELEYKISKGNKDGFLILRGGINKPNYYKKKISEYLNILKNINISRGIVIDCSHDNSKKISTNQIKVLKNVCKQRKKNKKIVGVIIEMDIKKGKQEIKKKLKYGISITDNCISINKLKKCLNIIRKYS
ncbi:3-deoxy-7-phosphoheptulonate synthase [Candidatus Vidania fulgoroideae]|nr:3-deoxy-7-phosphoheptulonate synthase [Candidatus Vidania fulgoroideae]